VYGSYVVKRFHRHRRSQNHAYPIGTPEQEAEHVAVTLERLQALQGIPGVPTFEPGPDAESWVEARAPGRPLSACGQSLTADEVRHVFKETVAFGWRAMARGFVHRRGNPNNTFFCRDTAAVTQIDHHHPSRDHRADPEFQADPEAFTAARVVDYAWRVRHMMTAAVWRLPSPAACRPREAIH